MSLPEVFLMAIPLSEFKVGAEVICKIMGTGLYNKPGRIASITYSSNVYFFDIVWYDGSIINTIGWSNLNSFDLNNQVNSNAYTGSDIIDPSYHTISKKYTLLE